MTSMYSRIRRLLAMTLCLTLLAGTLVTGASASEEFYLEPLAGNVVQVAVSVGHVAVLRTDGTVTAAGDDKEGQCQVSDWSRIVKIWAEDDITVGLTKEGRVMCTAFDLSGWTDIVDISISYVYSPRIVVVAGWRKDGTVMITGADRGREISFDKNWSDVVQVLADPGRILGVKLDGSVIQVGEAMYVRDAREDVTLWRNVAQLVPGYDCIFGITKDGKVLSDYGQREYWDDEYYNKYSPMRDWRGVEKLVPGFLDTMYGITYDGRVYSIGTGPLETQSLSDVVDLGSGQWTIVALRSNGSVELFSESVELTEQERARWSNAKQLLAYPRSNIVAIVRKDGTVVAANYFTMEPFDCDGWTDIVELYNAGSFLFVGLKEDGSLISNWDLDMSALTEGVRVSANPPHSQNSGSWKNNLLTANPLRIICSNKKTIASVTFLDSTREAPANAFAIGKGSSRRVLGWAEWDNGVAHVYIAADGGINGQLACDSLFKDCNKLEEINFNGAFHTDEAESMQNMFYGCVRLEDVDLSSLNTANVQNMGSMFAVCPALTELDLSSFDTARVTYMASMFSGCSQLRTVEVSHFDTSRVTDMSSMFRWCDNLREVDVSKWNVSRVQKYAGFMNDGMTINGKPWKDFFR